jgi:hypothetical protein
MPSHRYVIDTCAQALETPFSLHIASFADQRARQKRPSHARLLRAGLEPTTLGILALGPAQLPPGIGACQDPTI